MFICLQTAEMWVAFKYSQGGDVATLLWLHTDNFMDRGVDVEWVSAYPHEKEYVYPPLTYMKPIRKLDNVKVGESTYNVVEIHASMA